MDRLEKPRRRPLHPHRLRSIGATILCVVLACHADLAPRGWGQNGNGANFDPYAMPPAPRVATLGQPLSAAWLGSPQPDNRVQGWLAPVDGPITAEPLQPQAPFDAPLVAESFGLEAFPDGVLYPFYLADLNASRLSGMWSGGDKGYLEATLGSRVGLLRFNRGNDGPYPLGWQIDLEGAAIVRLTVDENMDLRSGDFRAGVPISWGFGRLHTRAGYYHLSSHVGDEFLLRHPGRGRVNYSRDVLYAGIGYWLTPACRIYAETGWAFYSDVSKEWEFAFGIERLPRFATGFRGSPFYAFHTHLREEIDFSGHYSLQLGWAWRRDAKSGLLRAGVNFVDGYSTQFSFFRERERLVGFGLWYDF